VLGNIRHADFELSPLEAFAEEETGGRRRLDKESIKWIAEVTGTEIQESDDGQRVSSPLSLHCCLALS
jgi:hypothetical protein